MVTQAGIEVPECQAALQKVLDSEYFSGSRRRSELFAYVGNAALEVHWNTPVVDKGFVYAFSGRNEPDANFRCVEFKTGQVMWEERKPGKGSISMSTVKR